MHEEDESADCRNVAENGEYDGSDCRYVVHQHLVVVAALMELPVENKQTHQGVDVDAQLKHEEDLDLG